MKSTTPAAHTVLLAPVVSEKSYSLTEDGKYTFQVHPDAHKTQIRQAVEEIFKHFSLQATDRAVLAAVRA